MRGWTYQHSDLRYQGHSAAAVEHFAAVVVVDQFRPLVAAESIDFSAGQDRPWPHRTCGPSSFFVRGTSAGHQGEQGSLAGDPP